MINSIKPNQFRSVTQSCPTLCNPVDCSTPGLPVHHQLQKFTRTHVHWVSDAIQPFHPLLSPSPPAFNLSQHQGLFKWVSSSHHVAKVSALTSVLPMNTQDWFPLGWTGWISLQSKGLSRVFSNTTVQKHQFFGAQLPLSVQFSSVAQSCPALCDTMNSSTPGLPVHHQLPESTQTHVHWVGDAVQPSHPLSPLSPPALNLSQYQGLF